jgi:YfiR/HmsC-like
MTRLAAAWGAALAMVCAPALADELEYPVKVEFIERFTRFIVWPAESFHGADGPFTLCVLGDTPAQPWLERLARERRIQQRRVDYKRLKPSDDLAACHLLFLAAGERARLKSVLARVSGKPVLTVGDSEGFAREGVIINLFFDDAGHVRFEISSAELRKSGLKVSAQLLRLARMVGE